jgi:hypothetical protein
VSDDPDDKLAAIADRNKQGARRGRPAPGAPRGENPSPAVPTVQDRLNRIRDRNQRGGYGEGAWFKTLLVAIVVALIVLYCVTDLGTPEAPPQDPPEADGILLQQVPSKPAPHPGSGSGSAASGSSSTAR